MEAELPNITGELGGSLISNYASASTTPVTFTGAFTGTSTRLGTIAGGSNHYRVIPDFSFDASNSNSVYQNKASVKPISLTTLLLIKY